MPDYCAVARRRLRRSSVLPGLHDDEVLANVARVRRKMSRTMTPSTSHRATSHYPAVAVTNWLPVCDAIAVVGCANRHGLTVHDGCMNW